MSFAWPPVETALSILTLSFTVKILLDKELIKTKESAVIT
jgi:hypothetical protein